MKGIILFVYLSLDLLLASGQGKYFDYNKSKIELLKKVFDTSCKDYNSERPVSKRMIRWDKKIIPFLNDVYNKDLTLAEIKARYAKISPKEISFLFSDVKDLGGFRRYETPIYTEGNLKVDILLIVSDDIILYKKFQVYTKRYTSCFDPPIFGISGYDVRYLNEHCLRLIDFPFSIEKWPFITVDKTYFENLKLFKAKGYSGFDIDSTKQLNDLIFYESGLYSFEHPSQIVKVLYKNQKVDSLVGLLYAPNHIIALNAMEALLALSKIKNMPLSADILNKMESIRNSDIKISWQFSDVYYHEKRTYRELNPQEKSILDKYRNIE